VVVGCEDGVLVLPESRVDDVLYPLDEIEACERELASAIQRRARGDRGRPRA
jgi:regulator of RNase E activity RraA